MTTSERFSFAFAPGYRVPALTFGITPATAYAELRPDQLAVRFGPWSLSTPLANVAEATIIGGFTWVKTAGPPRLSLADRGVSFATNGERGVCVRFHEPVRVLDPTGRLLRHPGATLTVARVDDFHERVSAVAA